jgi:DNA-directed RNA polymerase subunit RPC12/RpoP
MDAKSFECPNCGSPLTSAGWGKQIQCPYCRSTVIVPDELLAPQAQLRPFTNVLLDYDFNPSDQLSQKGKRQEIKDGHCRVRLDPTYGRASVESIGDFTNFTVEVDVQKISGADYGTLGVVARLSSHGFYGFEFNYAGHYGIFEYDSHYNPKILTHAHLDPNTVNQQGVNHIKGVCDHGDLILVLNDQVLSQIQSSTYSKGAAGFVINPGKLGNGVDVVFSNLVVKGP